MNRSQNNTEIEVFHEIEIDDSAKELAVLISHDYYGDDNDFGRTLLATFLDTLISKASSDNLVLLINGSAVNLLSSGGILEELISVSGLVYICSDSLNAYGIDLITDGNTVAVDSHAFFEEVLKYKPCIRV